MHEMTIRIYYEDTDFGGVVYYANYLKFLERGRTEALRALGVDQIALKEQGRVFVVRRANIEFLAPAGFDDLITVRTSASAVKGASAVMAQEIWRGPDQLITAEITVACMDLSGRPVRLPEGVRSGLVAQARGPDTALPRGHSA